MHKFPAKPIFVTVEKIFTLTPMFQKNNKFICWIILIQIRSNHERSTKKLFFKNLTIFTGKHLCRSLLFNKVADLKPATLLKKDSNTDFFPVNITKFLRAPILKNICEPLHLMNLSEDSEFIFDKNAYETPLIR